MSKVFKGSIVYSRTFPFCLTKEEWKKLFENPYSTIRGRMTKIIRVTGCHDCDKCRDLIGESMRCYNDEDSFVNVGVITDHYKNKTLPYNCPLEDERINDTDGQPKWDH